MADKIREIEKTVNREKGRLFSFIRKNVRIKEDAEDILQDVLYQLVSGFEEIEFAERISAWLMRVARNKITDWQRRKASSVVNEDRAVLPDEEGNEPLMLSEILPDFTTIPDEIYWRDILWEEINQALNEMPPEQSEVFILNEFEEMSFKEISEELKVPVNTLLSRKRYAVVYLRKRLKNLYED